MAGPPDCPDPAGDLATSTQILEAVFDTTPVLIAYLAPDFRFVRVNRAYAVVDGKVPDDFPGRNHFELYPNADNEAIFRRVVETGVAYHAAARPFEYARAPERGVTHWDWSLTPIVHAGAVTGLVLALVDVTARVEATRAMEVMVSELDHRVKNTLATVGAIADQTLVRATSLDDFRERFLGRLRSLARTHEALAAGRWRRVELSRVLAVAVGALDERGALLAPGSVDLALPPVVVSPLAMALYELATNAAKYGALAVAGGELAIRSGWDQPGWLALEWTEDGVAPAAGDPGRSGLGLRLVRGLIEVELAGRFELALRPGGRTYRLVLPVPEAAP